MLRRQARSAWSLLLLLIVAGFALALVNGCGGDPLMYPRPEDAAQVDTQVDTGAPADTGAPDAGKPSCRPLVPGDEISEAPRTSSGHTLVNQKCVTVCPALGGGVVCILPGGLTTYCDGCP